MDPRGTHFSSSIEALSLANNDQLYLGNVTAAFGKRGSIAVLCLLNQNINYCAWMRAVQHTISVTW